MSTIGISAPAAFPVRTATRLRLTARGRRVLVILAAVPLAFGIAFAAIGGGTAIAAGEVAGASDFATVMVMPGDTLWSIAESVAPATDPRTVIRDIQKLNALGGGSLQVGQQLAIPTEYAG